MSAIHPYDQLFSKSSIVPISQILGGPSCVRISSGDSLLHVLVVLLIHRAASAGGALGLVQSVILISLGAVDALLEDGLGLIELELGLEVMEMVRVTAAVGAATSVGELELLVDDLLAGTSPIVGQNLAVV